MKWNFYKKELRHEAADATEAAELAALARQVSQVKLPELSAGAKARIAGNLGITTHRIVQPWVLGSAMAAAIVLVSVVTLAQFSRPGSPLYSIKHQTDKLQQFINPEPSKSPVPATRDQTSNPAGEHESGSDDRKVGATPIPTGSTIDDKSGSGSDGGTGGSSGSGGTSGSGDTSGSGGSSGPSVDSGTSGGDSTSGGRDATSGHDGT